MMIGRESEAIKVVYGIDRNYLVPAAVSIHSLCERASAPLEIVVYGDGLEPSDHETLLKVGEAFGAAVDLRGYDPPPPRQGLQRPGGQLSSRFRWNCRGWWRGGACSSTPTHWLRET